MGPLLCGRCLRFEQWKELLTDKMIYMPAFFITVVLFGALVWGGSPSGPGSASGQGLLALREASSGSASGGTPEPSPSQGLPPAEEPSLQEPPAGQASPGSTGDQQPPPAEEPPAEEPPAEEPPAEEPSAQEPPAEEPPAEEPPADDPPPTKGNPPDLEDLKRKNAELEERYLVIVGGLRRNHLDGTEQGDLRDLILELRQINKSLADLRK